MSPVPKCALPITNRWVNKLAPVQPGRKKNTLNRQHPASGQKPYTQHSSSALMDCEWITNRKVHLQLVQHPTAAYTQDTTSSKHTYAWIINAGLTATCKCRGSSCLPFPHVGGDLNIILFSPTDRGYAGIRLFFASFRNKRVWKRSWLNTCLHFLGPSVFMSSIISGWTAHIPADASPHPVWVWIWDRL